MKIFIKLELIHLQIETLSQCQTRIESKRLFLVSAISTINQNLKSLCDYIPVSISLD